MDSTKQRELAESLFDRNKKHETGTDNPVKAGSPRGCGQKHASVEGSAFFTEDQAALKEKPSAQPQLKCNASESG